MEHKQISLRMQGGLDKKWSPNELKTQGQGTSCNLEGRILWTLQLRLILAVWKQCPSSPRLLIPAPAHITPFRA